MQFLLHVRTKSSTPLLKNIKCSENFTVPFSTHDITADTVKPEGWNEAKPFQCIPGPKALPIIKNNWRFLPIVGRLRNLSAVDMNKMFYEKYGEISRLSGTTLEDLVMVYSIKDIEAIFRNILIYPNTGSTAKTFKYYSASVPDNEHPILAEFGGNAWYEARTKLFPVLMNPQSVMVYAEGIDIIANHLVQKMRDSANLNPNREMPEDFNKYISAWILESVSFICLDKQLGCLDPNLSEDSEQLKFIRYVNEMYSLFFKIEYEPSVRNIYKTKTWKRFVLVFNSLITTMLKHIEDSIIEINSNVKNNEEATLLQKLLKIDKKLAITTAVNFIIAGVDTTSKLLGSGLYYLSKTPKAQETLRKELLGLLPTKDSPVTKEVLQNAPYLKATIKEITRLAPISVGIWRHTVKDMVLSGYQIPKGTNLLTSNLLLCHSDVHYVQAKEFIPERWIRTTTGKLSAKSANPFLSVPFGFGPRSCPGERLATLELQVSLAKVIRNFYLGWHHKDMTFKASPFYGIADPLKIRVNEVEK